jgi:hypothetical protein
MGKSPFAPCKNRDTNGSHQQIKTHAGESPLASQKKTAKKDEKGR